MRRVLAALALLVLATVALAGDTLPCGPYTSSCPGGPWEIVANEPLPPLVGPGIWVNDVWLSKNPETGKYERWGSDFSGESWEFNPPNEAIHSTWPAVGPPDLPQVGTYSGN